MPIHADYQGMYNSMIKKYGSKKGKEVFYATMKKQGIDYTKPRAEKKGENKYCLISNVEFKSITVNDAKEYHVTGFVSAPYVDDVNDYIPENLQSKIVERINNGFANRGSWNHDFLLEGNYLPVGSGKAELKLHPELKMQSAWVDVILDQDSPKFSEIKEEFEKKNIKGFSIEYSKDPKSHYEFMNGKSVRVFDDVPVFGFGIIGGDMSPVNSMAYADNLEYKAYFKDEVSQMADEKKEPEKKAEEEKKEEVSEEKKEEKEEVKEPEKKADGAEEKKEEPEAKSAEFAEFQKFKEEQTKQKTEAEFKAKLDEYMKGWQPTNNPFLVPGQKFESKAMEAEIKAYKDTIEDEKAGLKQKYKAAAKLHSKLDPDGRKTFSPSGLFSTNGVNLPLAERGFETTGTLMNEFAVKAAEYKAQLEHDTNKTSDSDYYQNAAELNDIYDPVIRSHLNDKTTLYGLLRKEDASEYPDRYGFRVWTGRIVGPDGSNYYADEGATLNAYNASMLKCQQIMVWYYVVVQVSGQMIAAARGRGGVGDIFAKQVERASADLLKGINTDLFYSTTGGRSGFTTGGGCLSLPYLLGTSDLYGLDRGGTYTTLQGTTTAKSGTPNPDKTDLRTAIRTVEKNGANRNDLVFVCDHIQKDKILGLLDDSQRILNTTPRAGFEGIPSFDGIPIYADSECDDGYLYLIDLAHTFLAVQVAPTYEDLAKTTDSKKGYIKTYFNLVCTAPNHNYLYTGYKTT